MKVTKLLQRTTSLFLALVMLFSFPVGAYSEGTGSNSDDALEVPEGYVWRALSVELAPFEEDCLEKEEAEAARLAEKAEEAARMMELTLSRDAAVAEEEKDNDSDPVITVRGWMPEYVTARAELVPYAEKDLYAELALMQVELRFYDAEGRLWTPEVPLTVFVDGTAIREARAGKMDPTVYVYEEDFEAEELRKENKRSTEEPERLFSVQAFSAARAEGQEKSYELEEKEVHADVVERALTADDEYPDAVCFETASGSLRFSVTARQQSRNYSAATEDGETEIVVVGALPTGLSAQVAAASVEADTLALPGEVIRGWDLSLTHPEEADYQIDGTVKVALHDAALADEQNENWELQLWQLRENDTPVRVKSAAFRGEDLRFSASELSSYVVVRVAVEKCLTASDGNTYSVRVSYDSFAGIPAGAELEVREILPEDADYAKYLTKGAACAGQKMSELDFARLFDISLRDPETGVEYQPNQNVKVSIELLSEEMNESTEVNVVHFGQETEVMGSVVNGDAIAFETKGFSVYVVMGVTLQKTITAADGNSYEISVSYDKNAGIPTDAELKVRELTGDEYQKYLTKTANYLSLDPEQLVYTRLFDITIEKDGVAYEPNQAVSVSIKLADRPETQGVLRVVHFGEEGTELLENELAEDGAVQFKTNSFSVYAISDGDNNIVVPRAWYKFYQYQKNGEEYVWGLTPDEKGGQQIIRNQGMLTEVAAEDLRASQGKYFLGWYVKDTDYKIEFNTPISVMFGNKEAVYADSVVVPREYDESGKQVNQYVIVEVEARYTSDYATVVYHAPDFDGEKYSYTTINTDSVAVDGTTTYQIPDATHADFTAQPDSGHEQAGFAFYGWYCPKNAPSLQNATDYEAFYNENNTTEPITSLSVKDGETYHLYPIFKKGHWVIFHTAPVGSGADYVQPEFVLTGGTATEPIKDENKDGVPDDTDKDGVPDPYPTWRGHVFRFWSALPTFNENGEFYQFEDPAKPNYKEDAENPETHEYNFNTVVSAPLDLYAVWEDGYATYTVIVWKQRISDDRDCPEQNKTYEFDRQFISEDVKLNTRETLTQNSFGIDFTALTENPAYKDEFIGFHHKTKQNVEGDPHKDTVSVDVKDNGSTVLNVYYNRNTVYMKFYNGSRPGYNATCYTNDPGYQEAYDDDAKWGYVNGHDVLLKKGENKTWAIEGVAMTDQPRAARNTPGYDGKYYTKWNNSYYDSGYTFNNPPTDYNTTYYCKYLIYGTNYSNYYQWNEVVAMSDWYYNDELFTGKRYKLRSDNFWFRGLYGQDLGMYGYSWPLGKMYSYYTNNQDGHTYPYQDYQGWHDMSMSFLGQFILNGVKDEKQTEMRLYYNSNSSAKIYFHLQDANGNYGDSPDSADYTGNTSGSGTFYFSEKFNGYTLDTYRFSNTQNTSWSSGSWQSAVNGASVQLSTSKSLHIRYKRRSYDISYYDSMDGQALTTPLQSNDTVKVKEDVLYGADITNFYPDAGFEPIAKTPGWSFNHRWYSDQECHTQIFFRYTVDEEGKTVPVPEDEAKLWYYYLKSDVESGKPERYYTGKDMSAVNPEDYPDREFHRDNYEILTEMPSRNLALYAGFDRTWYWVKIDPNGGELLSGQSTYFWCNYEDSISEYTVKREYVRKTNGTYYYHYDEFNTDDPEGVQPATRTAYYTDDENDPLLTDKEKKVKYAKTEAGNAYSFIGWFKVDENAIAGQQYKRFDFKNEKVKDNLILKAMWRQGGKIRIYYSDTPVDSKGNPVDFEKLYEWGDITQDVENGEYRKYKDYSNAMVPLHVDAAGNPGKQLQAKDAEGNVYNLIGWYFDSNVYAAGDLFSVNPYLVEKSPLDGKYDTLILYPVFQTATETSTGDHDTGLILHSNGGQKTENFDLVEAFGEDIAKFDKDKGEDVVVFKQQFLLNQGVTLPIVLPTGDIFKKEKAEFVGWAFSKDAKKADFGRGWVVGIDNEQGGGFAGGKQNILYAVWRVSEVSVKLRLVNPKNFYEGIPGGKFELTEFGELVSVDSENSSEKGWLAKDGTVQFNLKTPDAFHDDNENVIYNTYTLREIETALGFIPLEKPVIIKIDYYGNVTYGFEGDEDEDLKPAGTDGEIRTIYIEEIPAICKVATGSGEKLFASLNDALSFIEENMPNKTGTIQMIRNYDLNPDEDALTITEGVNVTLTTAAKNVKYPFLDEGTTATVTRDESDYGYSLFTVNGGSFALNNVVLDGAGDMWTGLSDGGLICVTDGGKLTVGESATLQNSNIKENGGAIYLGSNAEATVATGTIKDNKAANGGAIYLGSNAKLTVTSGTITGNEAVNSGAIYLGSKAEATVTGGTITGNKAANGAGIYVSADAKLKISGNINFGGSGVVGESLSTTSGNFSTTPISGDNPTNATMSYAYGRQDIYLAETEDDDPKMLFVTGELTGGDGTIWLWAESENHYGKNRDFAEVTSPALLTETTMHAFRNAREDSVTACGTKYLTGQVGTKQNWIAWTGGINVNFRKVDGFGKELAGAKFQLFTNLDCTESVMNKEGLPVTAISDDKGVVTFEMVSSGIYYVQEVAVPKDENGNDLYVTNTNTYILLVGKEYVKVPEASDKITGAWANVLLGIKQEEIDDQRNAYTEIFNDTSVYGEENPYKREVTDYAMFRLETKNNVTRYTTLPDIARIGIVNYSTTKRPVILSKINTVLMPLSGGKFTLRGLDGVEIENDNLKDSDESGVFFVGLLSVGTYLLEETQAPINPKNADEHYSVPKHYFVFQVTDQGVMALKKGQNDEQSFALTNTVTEASGEKYEIKNQNS